MRLRRRFVASFAAFVLFLQYILPVYPIDVSAEEVVDTFDLTVMHLNDTHSALENMPKTVTAVKEVRAENKNSLLFHAGDALTGTLYFNEFLGAADIAMLNLLGIDAMTFGNHEFDLGSSAEGHQKLAEFVREAKFPFVSSNVDFTKDEKFNGLVNREISETAQEGQIYDAIIKEVDGEKIGIFGLTTAETADISSPEPMTFSDYLSTAENTVFSLEAAGVNKIIAVTHIGYNDNAAIDNDITLAEQVDGIDIIVGGHTHTALDEPVVIQSGEEPTIIVQAGHSNSNLGRLDVTFDENGVITEHSGGLISIGDQAEDNEATEVLAPLKAQVEEVSNEEIGVSTEIALENPRTGDEGNTTGESVRKNETILGNLITDGMLEKARTFTGQNIIMAMQNGGGIRASIDAGPITVGEVITVLPFGNTLATMELTGAEIYEAFEHSYSNYPGESGGFLHVSGAKVNVDTAQPVGSRIIEITYENEAGEYVPLVKDETYTVATNAFTAQGGDGYSMFATAYADGRVTDLGLSDWENFREHLVNIGSDGIPTESEGRIIVGEPEEENLPVTIMHTNDTHAALDNMPKTATAVNAVRAVDPEALLLHAGDVFTGTLYFNNFYGQADLELMNYIGFNAMTFGNHEFDLGSSQEGHARLVDFIRGAEFPFVSSNVDFSGDALFDGLFHDAVIEGTENGQIYQAIIEEVHGEKIGIFGLTTAETKDISSPAEIAFADYLTAAEEVVEALEAQGVERIVALTHIGFDDNAAVDNDLILAEKVEGIDVIVGGHSHTTLNEPVVVDSFDAPTVIVQAGNGNSNLGKLEVVFDEYGVVEEFAGELIAIGEQADDPGAVEILQPYQEKVNETAQEEIGVTTKKALENPRAGDEGNETGESVRKNETILGNLITDGMLAKAREFTGKNVVMALQNGGGIRAPIDAGPITVGEVITVLPFGNTLATMDITGEELKEAFEISVGRFPDENGGFLHVSGGRVVYDSRLPVGERVLEVHIVGENGELVTVEDDVVYTIATNAFTAKGGDGYDVFAQAYADGRVTDLGLSDWENFRDHLVAIGSEGIPTEKDGRIYNLEFDVVPEPEPVPVEPDEEDEDPNPQTPPGPGGTPGGPIDDNDGNNEDDGDNNGTGGQGGNDGGDEDGNGNVAATGANGEELPSTATDMFNFIFGGLFLLAFGLAAFFVHRRMQTERI